MITVIEYSEDLFSLWIDANHIIVLPCPPCLSLGVSHSSLAFSSSPAASLPPLPSLPTSLLSYLIIREVKPSEPTCTQANPPHGSVLCRSRRRLKELPSCMCYPSSLQKMQQTAFCSVFYWGVGICWGSIWWVETKSLFFLMINVHIKYCFYFFGTNQ